MRILIVADDSLARAGLAVLLSDQPDCEVIGQIAGAAVRQGDLETFPADVLLWDLGWNSTASIEHLAELPQGSPPVVALISDVTLSAEVWSAGARGILPRESSGANLRAALMAVAQGLVALDPEASGPLLPSAEHVPAQPLGDLTPREIQVLQLLAEGLPNKAIGAQLSISEHTVKFHVNAIMGKLGAQSRTDAVMRATRAGLIIL